MFVDDVDVHLVFTFLITQSSSEGGREFSFVDDADSESRGILVPVYKNHPFASRPEVINVPYYSYDKYVPIVGIVVPIRKMTKIFDSQLLWDTRIFGMR